MNSVVVFLSVLFVGVRTMELTCKIQGSPLPVMCDGDKMEMPEMKKLYTMMEDINNDEKAERSETARYREERMAFEKEQDEKTDEAFKEIYRRIDKLEIDMYKRKCAYMNSDYCYMIKAHTMQDVTYPEAMKMCEEHKAMVAFVPDMEAYKKIMEKLRRSIPYGRDGISVWISTKVDDETGKLSDMDMDHYVKWAPGRPVKESSRKAVFIHASTSDSAEGMYNVFEDVSVHGVLCQMEHEWAI